MKKRILFVYPSMNIGGSTTSLISLLYALDPDKYDISLQLLENNGELQSFIPERIRIMPQARVSSGGSLARARSPRYLSLMLRTIYYEKLRHNQIVASQLRSLAGFPNDRRVEGEYDVAISFLETWSTYYTAESVNARHKIGWLHLNYAGSGIKYSLDLPYLKKFDRIVLVAEAVLRDFKRLSPELAERAVYIPNLLSREKVLKSAEANAVALPFARRAALTLATVCRIEPVKALDRAARVIGELVSEGRDINWLIIGDGSEAAMLAQIVSELGLHERVKLTGGMVNPMPYLKKCDAFFLPSLSEGMPMSVTEAHMLGLPALVTDYPAARDQVTDDGMVFENSHDGIRAGLEAVLDNPGLISDMRAAASARSYENKADILAVEQMLDEMD